MYQVDICYQDKEAYAKEVECKTADRFLTKMLNSIIRIMELPFRILIMMINLKENRILTRPNQVT